MSSFGAMEMLIILFVVLLLFGGKKIPELFRGLGKGLGEFKKGLQEGNQEEPVAKPGADAGKSEPPKPA